MKEIADASETGAATNIITGFSVALETTAIPAILIGAALLLAYQCGTMTGIQYGGIYGTAVATIGMLSVCAYVLAMDAFGPIADNAGGIVEMSQAPEEVRKRMDALDAAGNTTKALTKGYAIGSAALAVFLLFNAYMMDISRLIGKVFDTVNLASIPVFVGGLLGAMLIFLFAGFAIRAVSKTAQYVINESVSSSRIRASWRVRKSRITPELSISLRAGHSGTWLSPAFSLWHSPSSSVLP